MNGTLQLGRLAVGPVPSRPRGFSETVFEMGPFESQSDGTESINSCLHQLFYYSTRQSIVIWSIPRIGSHSKSYSILRNRAALLILLNSQESKCALDPTGTLIIEYVEIREYNLH